MAKARILGAILAGGSSERFGGDKAAAQLGGQALFDLVRTGLAPQVDALVCCGRVWPGLTTLSDWPEAGLGPLGGLCAALRHAEAEGFDAVLSVPVDVLPVPSNLIEILGWTGPSALVNQFLVGLWPATLAPLLDRHLRSGKRAVRSWLDLAGARPVDDEGLGLVNINYADDLAGLAQSSSRA